MLSSLILFIIGFTLGGLNYVVTVLQGRTRGMTLMRMPLTIWGIFTATAMALLAFPALFVAAVMMLFDRLLAEELPKVKATLGEDAWKAGKYEDGAKLFARITERVSGAVTHNCTLADLPGNDTFDTALYVNVLEHIKDDVAELVAARGRLAPGGKVVVFVPAMPSLYGTMDEVSGHFRRYRRAELTAVMERAGFTVESLRNFDPVGILPYWLSYRVLRRTTLGGATVGLYDRVIIPVSRAVSRLTGNRGPGKNLVAVASPLP